VFDAYINKSRYYPFNTTGWKTLKKKVFLTVPLFFFQSTDCFADKLLCQTIKNFLVTYFFRLNIFNFQCLCIPRVIPQRQRDFKWQHSVRVSQTVPSSYLSHVTAAAMCQRPRVHLGPPTCRCYAGKTAQIIQYPGSDLAASYSYFGYRCVVSRKGPTRMLAPPSLRVHKQTDLRSHDVAHCPHMW
jgi:hypothetical protein